MPEAHGHGPESTRDIPPPKHKNGDRRPNEDAAFETPLAATVAQASEMMAAARAPFISPDVWRDTWRPVAVFQSEMARWFDDLWREAASGRAPLSPYAGAAMAGLPMSGFAGLPRADLKETSADYRLHVELPGLKLNDVQVEFEGDALVIRGVKTDDQKTDAANFHITERRFGQVERRFTLPTDVDRAAVKADFRDGVLNIILPKVAGAVDRRRHVEVRQG